MEKDARDFGSEAPADLEIDWDEVAYQTATRTRQRIAGDPRRRGSILPPTSDLHVGANAPVRGVSAIRCAVGMCVSM